MEEVGKKVGGFSRRVAENELFLVLPVYVSYMIFVQLRSPLFN